MKARRTLRSLGEGGVGRGASENFARYPVASGLRSRSGCFGGVGGCGELHFTGILITIAPMTSLILKSRLGLSG